jgi:hypothetical protein
LYEIMFDIMLFFVFLLKLRKADIDIESYLYVSNDLFLQYWLYVYRYSREQLYHQPPSQCWKSYVVRYSVAGGSCC